jgi:hypothetical protein
VADKRSVKQLLLREVLQGTRIGVTMRDVQVEVTGDTARLQFRALLSRSAKNAAPQDIGAWQFDLSLRKEGRRWLIASGQYNRISGADFVKP